jgi:hypothetical protein
MKKILSSFALLSLAITLVFTACKKTSEAEQLPAEEKIVLSLPATQAGITLDQAIQGVDFGWEIINKNPNTQVTYRLKVWQLMQGQSGSQAMRDSAPVAEQVKSKTSEVKNTIRVAVATGPCKPPYLCDFVWTIQAQIHDANGTVIKTITSDVFTFHL